MLRPDRATRCRVEADGREIDVTLTRRAGEPPENDRIELTTSDVSVQARVRLDAVGAAFGRRLRSVSCGQAVLEPGERAECVAEYAEGIFDLTVTAGADGVLVTDSRSRGGAAPAARAAVAAPSVAPPAAPVDPREPHRRTAVRALEITSVAWLSLRSDPESGHTVLIYSHLASWRCGILEARYSVDSDDLDRTLPLPPCDPERPISIPSGFDPHVDLGVPARSVRIQLVYVDGPRSEPETFHP